jgi:predicted ABC-type ATPase
MAGRPEFFIIAGPNGAGKSTGGHRFIPSHLSVFNGDLILEELVQRYPHIEKERLHGGVASALEKERDLALNSQTGFAFESNYSTDMASEISAQFRAAGYKTILIYFGLDSLKSSLSRVRSRVNVGGHYVKPDVIQYNFQEAIIRVNKDLHLFDEVYFVDTRNQNIQIISLLEKKSRSLSYIIEHIPWYDAQFKSTVNKLNFSSKPVPHITPPARSGRYRS